MPYKMSELVQEKGDRMSDLMRAFLSAAVAGAFLAWLSWIGRRSKPIALNGQVGMIRPERWSAGALG